MTYRAERGLFFQFLLHMQFQGERHGYRLVVLYLPKMDQITEPGKDHFAPQRYFIEQQREKDRFFTDDSHRSAAGTDLVAHILQEHIGPR